MKAIGDDVCLEEGVIRHVSDLEDLLHFSTSAQASVAEGPSKDTPYVTKRTESWLRASSSQLHIVMNSPEKLWSSTSSTSTSPRPLSPVYLEAVRIHSKIRTPPRWT